MGADRQAIANGAFRVEVGIREVGVGGVLDALLADPVTGATFADGPYVYRAARATGDGTLVAEGLHGASVRAVGPGALAIRGTLAGLEVTHELRAPEGAAYVEERLALANTGTATVRLFALETGFTRVVANHVGAVDPALADDRLAAIPFVHRPDDPEGVDHVYAIADLVARPGREPRVNVDPLTWPQHGYVPARARASEGWAWTHAGRTLCAMKFNQDGLEFGLVAPEIGEREVRLRFGGAGMHAGDPSALAAIEPGTTVTLGLTRFVVVDGGHAEACLALRRFLDAMGCRFPADFDPPVHWNELYDNIDWNLGTPGKPPGRRDTRPTCYTRAQMMDEAAKAVAYGCQALYLDPGWDTEFGTFTWAERWMGPRKSFVDEVRSRFGLSVSLHCPLATWMSVDGRAVADWPAAALRRRADGSVVEGAVCIGSRQYLAEAERRMLESCADGVGYLMFDGNWWSGSCWNPDHGHPVPFRIEDQVRACLHLAQRIHARFPKVLIEMHDPVVGGTVPRYTPVYYTYGLPGSWDDNWGFELMWQPMEDIRAGRARSLYWYNLGCNVPVYLHVDLRDDNEHCLVLWWYASTCRHLGIGGTHPVPAIAAAQVAAMRQYRRLERFYKRGGFFGMGEEIHVHALPSENAFVVNLFNLSGEERVVRGSINVASMGLDPDRWYRAPKGGGFDGSRGLFHVARRMAPWSAVVLEVPSVAP
jgi:hypothetical protein